MKVLEKITSIIFVFRGFPSVVGSRTPRLHNFDKIQVYDNLIINAEELVQRKFCFKISKVKQIWGRRLYRSYRHSFNNPKHWHSEARRARI